MNENQGVGVDLGEDFIPDNIPERDGPLPKGEYICVISSIGKKENKAKTGAHLNVEATVVDGQHKGRKIWDIINLWNSNPQAVAIAQQTLAELTRAVELKSMRNTNDALNKPLIVRVAVQDDRNQIKKYLSIKHGVGSSSVSSPMNSPPPSWSASNPAAHASPGNQQTSPTEEAAKWFGQSPGGAPWTK